MPDTIVVGLDVGTTKVCAVIGERNERGELLITGVGRVESRGLRRGVVINIEATFQAVQEAVEAAELMSGREVAEVITGIAGSHIESLNSRGVVAISGKNGEVTQYDIDRALSIAQSVVIPLDREILHVEPQDYVVDQHREIKDPLDMIGVRLEVDVHIITGSITAAQNLVKCVNRAGFRVEQIVLQGLAAANAVLTGDEKEMGVLLIDLGGGTTNLVAYKRGAPCFTAVIPVGGTQVSSDLSIVLKVPVDAAEKLKVQDGACHSSVVEEGQEVLVPGVGGRPPVSARRETIANIMQARVGEIFSMVKEKVEKRGLLGQLDGGIVLTGGGALMPGAVELAQEVFGMHARAGMPMALGGMAESYQSPEYSTAVGLVLYGMDKMTPAKSGGPVKEKQGGGLGGALKKLFKNFFE